MCDDPFWEIGDVDMVIINGQLPIKYENYQFWTNANIFNSYSGHGHDLSSWPCIAISLFALGRGGRRERGRNRGVVVGKVGGVIEGL